jgi:hypothetical protein
MSRRILDIVAIAAVAAMLAGPAGAEGWHRGQKVPPDARAAPVKDCTRLNGRFGYYGNPWCTAQEQARWDRWSARRVLR